MLIDIFRLKYCLISLEIHINFNFELGFYTFLAQQQPFSGATFPPTFLQPPQQPTTTAFTNQPQPGANVPNNQSQAGAAAAAQQQRPAPTINNLIVNGRSVPLVEQRLYTLPPIWKRIVAEILDIFILFTLKVSWQIRPWKSLFVSYTYIARDPKYLFTLCSIWVKLSLDLSWSELSCGNP